jgi:hypothetical protein
VVAGAAGRRAILASQRDGERGRAGDDDEQRGWEQAAEHPSCNAKIGDP